MSQATCKVCQNRILIKRPPEGTPVDELVSAPGIPIPAPRQPLATPTRISGEEDEPTIADPEPPAIPRAGLSGAPSTLSAPLPGEGSGLSQLPETELSNSWREAILDNRPTVAMLKKMGLPGPAEGSTASGPAITNPAAPPVGAMPPPPAPAPFAVMTPAPEMMEPTVFSDPPATGVPMLANAPLAPAPKGAVAGKTAGTITSVQAIPTATVRVATPPRPFIKEGSSQLLSFATGLGASGIVAAQLWNGSWGAGLSGWLAFGAACFIAVGGLLNSLLRGPGALAVLSVGFLASLAAIAGMLAVFLTGGPRTRVMSESHTFLAPLAAFEIHLSKGPAVALPDPDATLSEPSPTPASSPTEAVESPAPSATP